MNKREVLRAAAALTGVGLAGAGLRAQETFRLTVAAVHPPSTPWVKLIGSQFVPEVRERVAALGAGWQMDISEYYGGQLYKMNATLTSVSDGIADIGWVLVGSETSRLPLSQFSAAMPFAGGDLRMVLEVITELHRNVPELNEEWERNGLVFLGAVATDSYHLFTREPIKDYAGLRGRRISAPGSLALWLRGSGAVAVGGALNTYYTDLQTGVSDGTLTIVTGVLPLRIHEVAPHVSLVDLGCFFGGGLAMNRARFLALPPPVRQIVLEAGQRYSVAVGELMSQGYGNGVMALEALSSRQPDPVTVSRWSEAQRAEWARSLPNLAADWVRQQRSPEAARHIVRAYMAGLRQRGARPLREWDKEV